MRPHLCFKESRMKVIDKLVKEMIRVMNEKKLNPQKMSEFIEFMPLIKLDLEKKDLGSYADL
jgi:hypothetical protein